VATNALKIITHGCTVQLFDATIAIQGYMHSDCKHQSIEPLDAFVLAAACSA